MKILHGPQNIGGMAYTLAHAQRELGHQAYSYSFTKNHFNYQCDYSLKNANSVEERVRKALEFGIKFDIFQFYFGESLLGADLWDVSTLSKLGKKIFFYFCGCDIRDEKKTIMSYEISACAACFPKLCSRNRALALQVSRDYGRVNFVSTPDLLEFVENSMLLQQPVDFSKLKHLQTSAPQLGNSETFVVAHAPTNQNIKGSAYVYNAVKNLQDKGLNIQLKLIQNMPHEIALAEYKKSDLAIDQLLVGAYGLVSAEMMAIGVPTVVYIRDDLWGKYFAEPPLINATPETIEDVILKLYERRDILERYREKGIKYAYQFHHPSKIAIQCLEVYN